MIVRRSFRRPHPSIYAARAAAASLAAFAVAAISLAPNGARADGWPPFAIGDSATVPRGGTVAVLDSGRASVLDNDFDFERDSLVAELRTTPKRGTVTLNADGTFLYIHNGSKEDSDTFRYRACEAEGEGRRGTCSSDAEVRITVVAGAVAPRITGQRALATLEDASLPITLEDLIVEDPDSVYPQDFTLTLVDGDNYSLDGTTVRPDPDFSGTLTVGARVNDGQLESDEFPLKVTVTAVNDAPVVAQSITPQQAAEGEPYVLETAPAFRDPDLGDSLAFTATGLPPSGSLRLDSRTGRLSGTPIQVDTLNLVYQVSVQATDRSGASVATAFELRILPRRFDLSIAIAAEPEPTTIAAAPQWSLTVTNASSSTSEPATLAASWYSTEAPVTLTLPSGCNVINNISTNPNVTCQIAALGPGATTVIRVQSTQPAPGDQAAIAVLEISDAIDANDAAAKTLNLAGSFNEAPAQRLAGPAVDLAVADLDGDGAPDLVAVSDTVRVFFNTGAHTFATVPVSPPGGSAGDVLALLDWNGDARVDIAVLRRDGARGSVFLNAGDRSFTAGPQLPAFAAAAAATLDSDADGIPELVVAGAGGTGIVGPQSPLRTLDARGAKDVVAADLNADGRDDLAVALNEFGSIAVLTNAGGGQFSPTTLSSLGSIAGVGAGDVSGDGAPDLLLAIDSSGLDLPESIVLRSDLNGALTPWLGFGATDTVDLLAADVNTDSHADVVSINASGVHQVYFGGGSPGLALQPEFLLSPGTRTAALADFDGDGAPDLFIAGASAPNIDVLRNNGIGRFGRGDVTAPVIQLIGSTTVTVPASSVYTDAGATASDDVSGDLTADIVVENPVNTAIVGTYQVRYSVSDRAGNASATVIRTVTVEAAASGGGGGGSVDPYWLAALGLLRWLRRRPRA